jgi:hypothetical protein
MTGERDMERMLERWLVDGIDEMPDRVYLSVVDRVERQPQQRAWRVSWRDSTVNAYLKPILAIAAVLVLAVGGIAVFARPSGSSIGVAVPSPSQTPSPSPAPSLPLLPEGRLNAGDYIMRTVVGDSMDFAITAPEGWTGFGGFFLGGPNRSDAPAGIGISVNHDPQVTINPCDGSRPTPAPASSAPSVDDLVAAISAREDVQVSGLTDTVLAGYTGMRLDVQFPAELACGNHYLFAEPKGLYANGPANRWRIWILDVDGETGVVVLLDYVGTPAADRAAAQAAIDSMRITPR